MNVKLPSCISQTLARKLQCLTRNPQHNVIILSAQIPSREAMAQLYSSIRQCPKLFEFQHTGTKTVWWLNDGSVQEAGQVIMDNSMSKLTTKNTTLVKPTIKTKRTKKLEEKDVEHNQTNNDNQKSVVFSRYKIAATEHTSLSLQFRKMKGAVALQLPAVQIVVGHKNFEFESESESSSTIKQSQQLLKYRQMYFVNYSSFKISHNNIEVELNTSIPCTHRLKTAEQLLFNRSDHEYRIVIKALNKVTSSVLFIDLLNVLNTFANLFSDELKLKFKM